jgi:hypothetical protein
MSIFSRFCSWILPAQRMVTLPLRCLKCNHTWTVTCPESSLLALSICPACKNNNRNAMIIDKQIKIHL